MPIRYNYFNPGKNANKDTIIFGRKTRRTMRRMKKNVGRSKAILKGKKVIW